MKRIGITSLAWSAVLLLVVAGGALATPLINGATVETRTFNDCSLSTLTTSNNYPASISITDVMSPQCVGFANLHSFSFSADGGATAAVFDNPSDLRFGADFKIDGAGQGEGGLRLSPWYGQYVDGRFMANATTGEIACFGGAIPFYSFTAGHNITYTKGTTIHLQLTYRANNLTSASPASIQYRVVYNGNTYDSPVLAFGEQNEAECVHGLWGMLNDGRAGGYFQPRANTGASLTATWSNITYTALAANVDLTFDPGTLNLAAHGHWVTAVLEPAAPYAPSDIDASSLLLNGVVAVDPSGPTSIGDFDKDGISDLTVKFDRAAVAALLSPGNAVDVTVTGSIAGGCFSATDQIKVTSKVLDSPVAGATYAPGTQVDVRWNRDTDQPANVSIVSTFDNGQHWNVEAQNINNNGRWTWTVPAISSGQARLGVVVIAGTDVSGLVMAAELGESGAFRTGSTTGVGSNGPVSFAMRKISPNPTRGEFTVDFSLPNGRSATLAVFDVGGRQVASRLVGGLGAGQHTVTFGRDVRLPAGVYHVRLTQDGHSLSSRATVIQQ